jgi:hypothetical protein
MHKRCFTGFFWLLGRAIYRRGSSQILASPLLLTEDLPRIFYQWDEFLGNNEKPNKLIE